MLHESTPLKKHSWAPAASVVALLLGFWSWLVCEPSWHGHKLSEWVELYGARFSGYEFTTNCWATQQETETAIRGIGSRSIPFLVRWIRREIKHLGPPGSNLVRDFIWKWAPSNLRPTLRRWWFDRRSEYLAIGAVSAFLVLNTNANSAIPDLVSIVNLPDNTSWENYEPAWGLADPSFPNRCALFALANIGPSAAPALLACATNSSMNARCDAVHLLSKMGTNARPALPLLLQIIQDPTNRLSALAARTLGNLKLEPETVIPALTNALERRKDLLQPFTSGPMQPRMGFQYEVLQALARYGPGARPAIPIMIRWLDNEDPFIPWYAADALGKMDTEPDLIVPALTRCLTNSDPDLVRSAAKSLGNFGSASALAIPALVEVTRRTNAMPPVRAAAGKALQQITNAILKTDSSSSCGLLSGVQSDSGRANWRIRSSMIVIFASAPVQLRKKD